MEYPSMKHALVRLPVSAALAAALLGETPSPGPVVSEPPLREIGHVRATTPFCKTVLTHALVGITAVLDNDVRIGQVEKTMREVSADSNPVVRSARWQELNREYAALRTAAVGGRASMRLLKGEAANAPTAEQKTALTALAGAIDGALARQNKLGDLVGRLAQYVDNHAPLDDSQRDRARFNASVAPLDSGRTPLTIVKPHWAPGDTLTEIANKDADELEQKRRPLELDEDDAATKIDPAFSGC